ncbi:MAG: trypsin-like peptidase domain-containing protein [Gammaproteobacteria bacterium]|nr:trypsin-like peptidase domain-containing protein [Gammaproteobacteria bacterium]
MSRHASLAILLACLQSMASAGAEERLDALEPRAAPEPTSPSSWQTRQDYARVPVSRAVVLPPMDKVAADPSERVEDGGPLHIGVGRNLPETDQHDLTATVAWTGLPDGRRVASFSVRSPGAVAIRVAVTASLPQGAVLRFFGSKDPNRRYPVIKNDVDTRWSPTIPGDTAGIEIDLPAWTHDSEVSLRVVRVSHIYTSPTAVRSSGGNTCETVEVACKSLPTCPTNAVARMTFTLKDGTSALCTGTAANSRRPRDDNLDTPYFLTAAHCINSQIVADTLETRWFYEYDSCESPHDDPDFTELFGGAALVAADADTDATLLQLRDALPNDACLAGWNTRSGWPGGADVTSLHHSRGDPKQWSGGSIEGTVFLSGRDLIRVAWAEGFTVGGASGAGLFDGSQDLIGILSGGPECVVGEVSIDFYGRFDRFYHSYAGVHLQHDDPPPVDDHGDAIAEATPVVSGSEVTGEIDQGSDADVFRVVVLRRGTLTVYTTGSVDTIGRLKREDGSTLTFNDDDVLSGTPNFRIDAEVAPGAYYIKVSGFGHTDLGAYRLHVEFTADTVLVPLFLAASALDNDGRQGFVRVVNRSDGAGDVRIVATDDAGTSPGAIILTLDGGETQAFNSQDLEEGNADKGLAGRTESGSGDWRLALDSELDIEVQAFVRTTDGFLTAIHDVVAMDATGSHYVPVFNPASNVNQRSRLRLVNPDPANAVVVTVTGIDDAGDEGQSAVELELAAGSSRTLDSAELEEAFGDGVGKWRLWVESDGEIHLVNLLDSVSGDLTNLSTRGADNYRE